MNLRRSARLVLAGLCSLGCSPGHAQAIPPATTGIVYLRSDTVAYPANFVPATGLPNAQVSLSGAVTATSAAGTFVVPSSTTPTSNFVPLATTLPGYMPTWYPWVPEEARQPLQIGLYPEIVGTARPGFINGIIAHDAGGFVPTHYRAGDFATTFDRIRNVVGGNLVTFVDPAFVTSYSATANTVTMVKGNQAAGGADLSMYQTLVGQAHARGLQFMMMLGIEPGQGFTNFNPGAVPGTQTAFWDAWFAAYQPYVLDKVAIARDLGIEYVALGYNDAYMTQQPAERWRGVIAAIRAAGYTGKIAYFGGMGSPRENDQEAHYYDFYGGKDPNAFMRLFDAIGVNIYWIAIPKFGTPDPYELARSRSAMRDDLRRIFGTLTNAPVPILMMIGTPSVFGGSSDPTYIEPCCIGPGSIAKTRTRDLQQQADVYQAAGEIINESPMGNGRVMGLLSWGYDLRDNLTQLNGPGDSAYDKSGNVRGKPAEAVMRSWFQRWAAVPAAAIEYHHAAWDHYFLTSIPDEIAKLDNGTFAGWARTGESFNVYPTETPGTSDQCRFFSTSFNPKSSHFYTALASECTLVKQNPNWQFEGLVAALVNPDGGGACTANLRPLYRLYNAGQGGAPNHRYTTSTAIRAAMIAQGWTPEGYGPVGVIACVPT